MGISSYPSKVTLPNLPRPYPSLLDFLAGRFPAVGREKWERRISEGKVLTEDGSPVKATSNYIPSTRIFYFREVEQERIIPFSEEILFQDEHLLVACKPHFLPVTPGGAYVGECLLNRLKIRTGVGCLAPVHRIDRGTAGLVMFSVNSGTSDRYHQLFRNGNVEKTYQAISVCSTVPCRTEWMVENRIVTGEPWFRMKIAPGDVNARSKITLTEACGTKARFRLSPLTGQTHQLRLHMCCLGLGIQHDRLYPDLQPESDDDFGNPLQLLAQSLRFKDPITGKAREFISGRRLLI